MTPDQANTTVSDDELMDMLERNLKDDCNSGVIIDALHARRATAEVTEAMVERAWDYFYQANEWAPPKNHLRAALLAALNPPIGR